MEAQFDQRGQHAESLGAIRKSGIDFGIGLRLVYGTKVLYGYTNETDVDELRRILTDLAAKDLRDPTTTATSFNYARPQDLHPANRVLSTDPEVADKVAFLIAADGVARGHQQSDFADPGHGSSERAAR